MFNNCYTDKKVLITGHTGFKGSWLSLWLTQLGAKVYGAAVDIPSNPSHFKVCNSQDYVDDYRLDVCDFPEVRRLINEIQPDFVFHLAAQALVRQSYRNPIATITTNAIGTANVLEALRLLEKPVVAVMITSDKAYDNVESVWGYRENDRLGGKDPYSASKGMAELAIRGYVESFFAGANSDIRIGIGRAGNVIGGGDWANDRIVVDCVRSWSKNETAEIRNPDSTRPWQHVLEPLSGYLSLAADLCLRDHNHGEAYNFGPPANQNYSVRELIDEMRVHWSNVRWEDASQPQGQLREAGLLKLNCDKALFDLNWHPTLQFSDTVKMTVEWYKNYYEEPSCAVHDFSVAQIMEYCTKARKADLGWA